MPCTAPRSREKHVKKGKRTRPLRLPRLRPPIRAAVLVCFARLAAFPKTKEMCTALAHGIVCAQASSGLHCKALTPTVCGMRRAVPVGWSRTPSSNDALQDLRICLWCAPGVALPSSENPDTRP